MSINLLNYTLDLDNFEKDDRRTQNFHFLVVFLSSSSLANLQLELFSRIVKITFFRETTNFQGTFPIFGFTMTDSITQRGSDDVLTSKLLPKDSMKHTNSKKIMPPVYRSQVNCSHLSRAFDHNAVEQCHVLSLHPLCR